jgi:peroxidase
VNVENLLFYAHVCAFFVCSFSCLLTEKPHLIDEPKDVEISFGGTAVFVCRAQGDPQPEIKWMLNSNEIPMTDDRFTILPDGSLRIDRTTANDIGHYECMAKNEMGETVSRPARMILYEDDSETDEPNSLIQQQSEQSDEQSGSPRFLQTPEDSIISSDQDIVLQCMASGVNIKIHFFQKANT